jgi:hypothetical protein
LSVISIWFPGKEYFGSFLILFSESSDIIFSKKIKLILKSSYYIIFI